MSSQTELDNTSTLDPMDDVFVMPASFGQQRFWVMDQLDPGNSTYNMPAVYRLNGRLNVSALERTLNEIIRRHESLRTSFAAIEDQLMQIITPVLNLRPLPLLDLSHLPAEGREAEAIRLATEEARQPFNLAEGPLMRIKLLRLAPEEHIFVLVLHHIISDGWSMSVFYNEFVTLYESFSAGQPSPLPELPLQYADFAIWQRDQFQEENVKKELDYWQNQLQGPLPVLALPTDHPRPAVQTHRGSGKAFVLSASLTKALKGLSQSEGATLFMTLLAAFQTLLYRYTGQEDILVGSPIANRNRAEIEKVIGLFINTLVLRTDLSGNPGFYELLRRVREVALGAYSHQEFPFEKVLEAVQPGHSRSYNPLFQVLFVLQNTPKVKLTLSGLTIERLRIGTETAKVDLTLVLQEEEGQLKGSIGYNTDLFEGETIGRMIDHWQTLLAAIVANPNQPIASLPLLTEAEQHRLLVEWNQTRRDYPQTACIHHLFEAQVARTPEAIALLCPDILTGPSRNGKLEQRLTYQELNRRANQLAHYLQTLGVGPEERVGICLDRSPEMIIALLAVLKAGGGYIPLDPVYPDERLSYIIQDAQVSVLVTQTQWAARFAQPGLKQIYLDREGPEIARHNSENPQSEVAPSNLAYVIYTSGSTGKPKGVMIEHRALVNFTTAAGVEYGIEVGDRVLQFASISFDASAEEIYPCLTRGATLVLRPEAMLDSIPTFLRCCRDWGLTVLDLPTAYWHELSAVLAADKLASPEKLRLVIIGGERALPERLKLWQKAMGKRVRLVNTYGPTEATVVATLADLTQVEVGEGELAELPIGRPLANVEAYVLDQQRQPVPIGVAGELHLGGAGLARGYLNQPALTQEKFIPNPFNTHKKLRMKNEELGIEIENTNLNQPDFSFLIFNSSLLYRTGDLVRYLPDGNIEFLGRVDQQVKLRGFRIELGEIEAVLSQHPAVQEAVVTVYDQGASNQQLVAYLVPKRDQEIEVTEARSFLKEKLPDYMVPAFFMKLERIPMTPNGKLDRQSLPAPDSSGRGLEEGYVAARTETEKRLADIWAEVLELERVGIYDNFFELGGHSLLAVRLLSRLRATLQVELPLRSLFEAPTISSLAEWVQASLQKEQAPIERVSQEGPLPLSFAQRRLWFLDQMEPGSPTYNISAAYRLTGLLDVAALEQSLNEVVRRHSSLRTTFTNLDGEPAQIITPSLNLPLPVIDLSALPEAEQKVQVEQIVAREKKWSFDLRQSPLLRLNLLRLSEQEHILTLVIHHIVSDGWSINILFQELSTLYTAFSRGEPSPLPDLPIQYVDFALWQQEWLQGERLATQLNYWKEQLKHAPPELALPTDRPRPPVQSFRGAVQQLLLPKEISLSLKQFSQAEGGTLFMSLLAAFKILLHRYTGQTDIVVGTPIANRNRIETEGLIGFLLNNLVLRTDLSGSPSFRDLLSRVRRVTVEAYEHQDLPFEKLLEELQVARDLSRSPLFQVYFNMLSFESNRLELPGLVLERLASVAGAESKFDLTMYVAELPEHISLRLVYNTDLFDQERMVEMLEQFKHLLVQIVENPDQEIASLSLVTPAAQPLLPNPAQPLRSDWHGAVHTGFSHQAHHHPDRLAVVDHQECWSYAELESRSNQLANYLLVQGIQPGDIVAVYAHRSSSLVWALLGILKAGAAFVILDPAYPIERLIEYLRVTQPRAFIQVELAGAVPEALHAFVTSLACACRLTLPQRLALGKDHLLDYSSHNPEVEVGPDNLAYIAFTSGSTGQPKAVMGSHSPLSHFLHWHSQTFQFSQTDRFSLLSGLSHDPLLRDVLMPLWLGATLYIPAPEVIEMPGQLAVWMKQHQITVTHLTPAMAQILTETYQDNSSHNGKPFELPHLRYAFFGGDVLTKRTVSLIRQLAPVVTCVNFYGATETPQAMGYTLVADPAMAAESHHWASAKENIPVGKGIEDVQLLVLTAAQQLAGMGEVGEIYIRTPYLAKGYKNDERLTQERFLPNPFTKLSDDRLYKTGDLGRYRLDGAIEFLGRVDHQVKIRGFRIELGEIEAVLDQHPAVRQAVVAVREDTPGDKRLAAYVVPQEGQAPGPETLRQFLAEKLPNYMVPTFFTMLTALPLTPTGKVDRHNLPVPAGIRQALEATYIAPRDELESQLIQVWQEVLGIQAIGIRDNFFELGGHSLLAVRLLARIEKVTGQKLHLATLFQGPTIEQQARILQEGSTALLLPVQPNGSKLPFFCVPGGRDNAFIFTDLARHLGEDQPLYSFRFPENHDEQTGETRIKDMAAQYIQEMRLLQPEGPYLLGGYCFGGRVAFEMAQQLQAQGQQVGLVAIFESYLPGSIHLPGVIPRVRHHLNQFVQLSPKEKWSYLLERSKRRIQKISRKLSPDLGRPVHHALGGTGYVPQPYPGRITLFHASERSAELHYDSYMGWGGLAAGGIEVYAIPGTHINAYKEPNVRIWAKQMKACLDKAQAPARKP